ncbi:hypothetical protein [Methylohalobius crimeensis]|uniref:hypothetical protein n=1 Tax=Methylohalobius crimeensis TaxID=244365 RepID=UPI0003B570A8|nr:hypothetical protein [Methylohalobius crimeensis]
MPPEAVSDGSIFFVSDGSFQEAALDDLAPAASTESAFTILATLQNPQNRLYLDYSGVFSTAQTFSHTNAIAANFSNPIAPNAHIATGGSSVDVSPTPFLYNGGVNIATISNSHNTNAFANASEPLIAKAVTGSQGAVTGIGIQTDATCQPETDTNTLLNIAWNAHQLDLQAHPTVAFAIMRDTVNVIQQVGDQVSINTVGFVIYVENGETTRIPIGSPNSHQSIEDWFQQNLSQSEEGVSLNGGSSPLNVPVVLMDPCNPQNSTVVSIQNTHTEGSYEAPPRAVPQVAEKAGYIPPTSSSGPNIHWNPNTNLLSFDPVPINVLTGGPRNTVSPRYRNDPLNGGTLEIDPLLRFTNHDGREYFTGDELRIFDKDGNLLLQTTLPTLVYEDTLGDEQGFNLFGPILNIEQAQTGQSDWLDEFLSELTPDSDLIPELFVGLDFTDEDLWEEAFDQPGKVFLSFAGLAQVPAPAPLMLLLIGLLVLFKNRRLSYKRHVESQRH